MNDTRWLQHLIKKTGPDFIRSLQFLRLMTPDTDTTPVLRSFVTKTLERLATEWSEEGKIKVVLDLYNDNVPFNDERFKAILDQIDETVCMGSEHDAMCAAAYAAEMSDHEAVADIMCHARRAYATRKAKAVERRRQAEDLFKLLQEAYGDE